ncbi:MAG: hypothetical protein KJ056_10485 [Acidimicrobiia bacterium]|nr:hypothetical protein [Acidimicrobiia bacterium]
MNITEATAVVTLLERLDTALRSGPVPLAVAREAGDAVEILTARAAKALGINDGVLHPGAARRIVLRLIERVVT